MSGLSRIGIGLLGILGAAAVGWGVEFVLRRLLHAIARRTGWRWGDVLARSLRGLVVAGALLGALVWALRWWGLPERALTIGDRIVLLTGVGVGFIWLLRLSVGILRELLHDSETLPSVSIVVNVVRLVVVVVAVLVILQILGIPITPLLTALGVGGLAIALALQDTLSNLFAGLHILAARQVHPGDFIRLDSGHEGVVIDINWRNTTIRTLANNLVILPNSRLANSIVVNYRVPQPDLTVTVPVRIGYSSDLEHVERVTLAVARQVQSEVPGAVRGFEPAIRFQELGDSGIYFNVVLQAEKAEDQYLLRHEFIKRLFAAYRAEGIEIPFPMRQLVGSLEVRAVQERYPGR